MKIRLDVTAFRRMVRPLSVYTENSRANEQTLKVKWDVDSGIRIFGYHSPKFQTTLSVIRLENSICSESEKDHPSFLSDIPTIRGLGTATKEDEIIIDTAPGQNYLTIRSEKFSYNIEKARLDWDMSLRKHYFPMNQIQLRGCLSSTRVRKYFEHAEGGPLRLKISNRAVRFVTEVPEQTSFFDITDDAFLASNDVECEYSYNLALLSEMIKKFPNGRGVELFVNNNLLHFRYEIGGGIGYMNYYQQGKCC